MATVWELIQVHSTAPPGSTFWEHLNAQEGGGEGGTFLVSELSVDVLDNGVSVELKEKVIDVTILE